jgi:transcriptional regulator with XRE-family HTH domain
LTPFSDPRVKRATRIDDENGRMDTNGVTATADSEFGRFLEAARGRAGLSQRRLARASRLSSRRIASLERGDDVPTEAELGALAHGCNVSVFDLLPPGYSLRVLVHDTPDGAREVAGAHALEALLQEYLSMVVEMRSGRPVTAPSLRHEDLVELAASLGDTPESIEARLVALLGADSDDAAAIRSMILPSTAANTTR